MVPVNNLSTIGGITNATLSWDAVVGSWGYRIRYKKTSEPWNAMAFDTVTTNSYSLSNLPSGTNYQWQVMSMCDSTGVNTSSWTSMQYFTTLVPSIPCDAPIGLSSSVVGTSVTLSWTAVSTALKYDLRRRVQGTSTWIYLYNLYSTTRTINNFSQSTIYEWEVRTQCNSGSTSSWSATETFTISGPCSNVQNPDEQNLTNNSVDLIWDAVAGAVNYKIKWRKLGSGVNVQFINTNLLSLTGLDHASTYKWKVRSECDATSSNVSSFTSWQFFSHKSSIRISSEMLS